MAKKIDPFETFKAVTLGNSPKLSDAISGNSEKDHSVPSEAESAPTPQRRKETPAPAAASTSGKPSKNANMVSVGFLVDKDLKKRLARLKVETGISLNDLYAEGIEMVLKKYKM